MASTPFVLRALFKWAAVSSVVVSIVVVPAAHEATAVSGATTLAEPCAGSTDPTLYPNNHRTVVTPSGRQLALYDPAGSGLQLSWRDPNGAWSTKSLFTTVSDEVTTDRPASIALDGTGNAWVVWSGYNFSAALPLRLRRLTNLDAPQGPTVGPVVTVAPLGGGNAFADLAFHEGRGFIVWLQHSGDTYSLRTTQFSDLQTDTPSFENGATLYTSSSSKTVATLVPTSAGMHVVARAGALRVWSHDGGAQWRPGSARVGIPSKSKASAISWQGDILAAFQASPYDDQVVKVVRFSSNGDSATTSLITAKGYVHPSLARNGAHAWVIMVRRSTTSSVVSRRFDGSRWEGDVMELAANAVNGGDYSYPNAVRNFQGTLRFIVDAKRCPSSRAKNGVLAYERTL